MTRTDRERPIDRIVPLQNTALEQLVAESLPTPADGDLLEMLDSLALPVRTLSTSPTSALDELRQDER